MIKKIYRLLNRYKIATISAIVVFIIGICIFMLLNLFIKKSIIHKVDEKEYSFEYDHTWKLKEKKKDTILLKHNTGSKIKIQMATLSDKYKYLKIDELMDELIYNIQKQNSSYKLLSRKKEKITKDRYDGYKLLYENNKEQVMLNFYKKSDRLITISYEASNDSFDILLDSVQNIIYHLNIKEKKINLKRKLKIKTDDIDYEKSDKVDKLLNKSTTYEIADNHYLVKYSLPSSFIETSLNSQNGYYELEGDNKSGRVPNIRISTSISYKNIYTYIDKKERFELYNNYSSYKKNKDYSDFKESLGKLDSNYDSYIYKNSYYYNKAIEFLDNGDIRKVKRKYENVQLIYALNKNHIFIVTIQASGTPITEKLINKIKVISSKNYASYIKIKKENNFIIGKLQDFKDNEKKKIKIITLKIPDKYKEIDKGFYNLYEKRNYVLDTYEYDDVYNYEIQYEFSDSCSSTSKVRTDSESRDKVVYSNDIVLNDRKFKVYNGNHTLLTGPMFTDHNRKEYKVNESVLFYEIPEMEDACLVIDIKGNNKEITNEVLNELTNFTVEEKERRKKNEL